MQLDQGKFYNVVLEKTNAKLSQLQNQNIVLEAQLHLAVETNKLLQEELDKLKKKKDKSTQQDDYSSPN